VPKTSSSMPQNLTRINPGAAAVDIGSTMHMAAVNPDCAEMPIRHSESLPTICMILPLGSNPAASPAWRWSQPGSTGIPAYEILE